MDELVSAQLKQLNTVAIRVDASIEMGTGHVMRCLTLADALRARGIRCQFISRAHPGNLIELIRGKGYVVHALPVTHERFLGSSERAICTSSPALAHLQWLGATQAQDAEACAPILGIQRPDWLIVDHYALDARWERVQAAHCRKLMVIDDLADRPHACDMLLDQTFGRDAEDYRPLVPADCLLLCGAHYAMLRPEFAALRPYSLQRRAQPVLRKLLITMGGVDKDNATGLVLQAIRTCALPADCQITIVMGVTAPWLYEVQTHARNMPWPTRVLVNVRDMAQLMADSDLAIGAAGATSWERCCLGLPTIMLVLADNQLKVALGLEQAGAAVIVPTEPSTEYQFQALLDALVSSPEKLRSMSEAAADIIDGMGTLSVTALLESSCD